MSPSQAAHSTSPQPPHAAAAAAAAEQSARSTTRPAGLRREGVGGQASRFKITRVSHRVSSPCRSFSNPPSPRRCKGACEPTGCFRRPISPAAPRIPISIFAPHFPTPAFLTSAGVVAGEEGLDGGAGRGVAGVHDAHAGRVLHPHRGLVAATVCMEIQAGALGWWKKKFRTQEPELRGWPQGAGGDDSSLEGRRGERRNEQVRGVGCG